MIVGLFPELLSSGGVQRVGRHLAAALANYAERVTTDYCFLSLNDPSGEYSQRVGHHRFIFSGCGRAKGRFVLEAVRQAMGRRTVVLSAHPNLGPVACAMRTFAPHLRSIVVVHGIEVWNPLKPLRRWALRGADLVLAPSQDTASKAIEVQGVRSSGVRRLPWGLDPEFLIPADSASLPNLQKRIPPGRVILTVGRMAANERYKGLDVLIEALPPVIAVFSDARLVVVGEGDDRKRLEALVRQKDLMDRVLFLGALRKEELIACYRRSDVFAMPSRGEGFGLVFLEAMALGKPVVGPHCGAPAEFIRHGDHGLLVDPEDPEAVAKAILRLLSSPDRASRMGQAARDWVAREYSYERFCERLYRLLGDGLANGTRRACQA